MHFGARGAHPSTDLHQPVVLSKEQRSHRRPNDMDDDAIRKQVRDRLKEGRLPRHGLLAAQLKPGQPPPSIVAGSRLSDPCAVCDETGTQIRYPYPNGPLAFHHRCEQIWREERDKPTPRI